MKTLKNIKTTRYQLETLTCPSCITRIEGVLNKEPGVEKAKVLFNSSRVKVEYDEEKVSSNRLAELIEKVGYPILPS
ncbi:Copper-exporting P-type ATPase [Arenibacter antarcticus]|uniref:Heavy-metal-associated domain-containing protein n=1 Tax=Arenibacter antarcticus TaxID=2040469 RepID=A0ABW5VBW9_9FLAO|nr:cation transporter [Arenibacter sp. H213]MCM4167795.1 heavy metal-binding protein [Arenibacter sp. H213]